MSIWECLELIEGSYFLLHYPSDYDAWDLGYMPEACAFCQIYGRPCHAKNFHEKYAWKNAYMHQWPNPNNWYFLLLHSICDQTDWLFNLLLMCLMPNFVHLCYQMTVEAVKEKLWRKSGTSVDSMCLELFDDTGAKVSDLADNMRPLGFYSPQDRLVFDFSC